MLTIIDEYTRECPAIEVDTSIGGQKVIQVLDRIASDRGFPESIVVDNGPEFISRVLDAWAYKLGVRMYLLDRASLQITVLLRASTAHSVRNV